MQVRRTETHVETSPEEGRLTFVERRERVHKSNGCFMKYSTCIILAIILLLLLVLVGVIVYFAKPEKVCGAGRTFWSFSKQEQEQACTTVINNMKQDLCQGNSWSGTGGSGQGGSGTGGSGTGGSGTGGAGGKRPATATPPVRWVEPRLNRKVVPSGYNIQLQPRIHDGGNYQFNGTVEIRMRAEEATNVIVLHSHELTIRQGSVVLRQDRHDGPEVEHSRWTHEKDKQFLKIFLPRHLSAGTTYYLKMAYDGSLHNDDMLGGFRTEYTERNRTHYMAATQFELNFARKVFPCWDEPSFKARYNVTIIRKEPFLSLSNMPLKRSENRDDGWKADVYEESVVMSPYLVAFTLSEFTSRDRIAPRGTRIRVWSRPTYIESVEYALDISGTIVEALEDWTGIPQQVPKIDQVAVPKFLYLAMENWGLIIYGEDQLLFNSAYSSASNKFRTGKIISHEICHQWFGNLVTTKWWDDLFLNEAMATYIAHTYILPKAEPTWNMEEYYSLVAQSVMRADTSAQTQPVHIPDLKVLDDNWFRAFDDITYHKGGSILRMTDDFLGKRTFQEGVKSYLRDRSYKSAVHDDLFRALQKQAELDSKVTWDTSKTNLSGILYTWIKQTNYPLVTVKDLGNGRVRLQQSHFYDKIEPLRYSSPFGQFIWDIPLTIADRDDVRNGDVTRRWMHREKQVEVAGFEDNQWKLVNLRRRGFYRVQYDPNTYNALLQQLWTDHKVIPVENRAALIDDSFCIARAGLMSTVDAFKSTQYLKDEDHPIPWQALLGSQTQYYDNMFHGKSSHEHFTTYMRELVIPMYDKTGWEVLDTDPIQKRFLRQHVMAEACARQHRHCVNTAVEKFNRFMEDSDNNRIHPDLRPLVYCTGVAQGSVKEWEFIRDMINRTRQRPLFTASEDVVLTEALSCATAPAVVRMHLLQALQRKDIGLVTGIGGRQGTQGTVWNVLKDRWADIPDGPKKQNLLSTMAGRMTTEGQLTELRNLLTSNGHDANSAVYRRLTKGVRRNIDWLSDNEAPVADWLRTVNLNANSRLT